MFEQLNGFGNPTRKTEMLGKALLEGINKNADNPFISDVRREKYAILREKVTCAKEVLADDASLYSTIVSQFIEEAYQPKLVTDGVIKTLNFQLDNGANSIKIPKDGSLSAQAITATGTFGSGEDTTAYGDTTITLAWNGAYTSIPYPLMRWSNVELMGHRLGQIGKAIANKVDDDVLTQMEKASTKDDATYGDNSNYSYMGATTALTFDGLVNGLAVAEGNNVTPTDLILTPSNYGVVLKNDDVVTMLAYASNQTDTAKPFQTLLGMKVHVSSQLTAKNTLLVDRLGCGYLAEGSGIETWDGRVDNTIQMQVVGAKNYGTSIVRPVAVTNVIDNTAEPT